jgi:hypothetical protein
MRWTRKEWLLVGVTSAVLFVIVNIACYTIIRSQFGLSMYEAEPYRAKKNAFKRPTSQRPFPHPFFGLSVGSGHTFASPLTAEPLFDHVSLSPTTQPVVVLVLGGSVAAHLSNGALGQGTDLLAKGLNRHFKTDRFVVYSGAFGGGKQPQQYFKYQYLDLIGFRPDIVINLDGFNEIALPLAENLHAGNPAIFPRSHSGLLRAAATNRSCVDTSNAMLAYDTGLPLAELMIWLYVRRCHRSIEQQAMDWPWWSAPAGVEPTTDYVSQSIAIWEQSSNKLHESLAARGIDYIHVLQPNQYLEHSKVFTTEEASRFLSSSLYGKPIREHYHKLSRGNLTVPNFTDQRLLFKDISETVYADACCHLNNRGLVLIIEDIINSNEELFGRHLKGNAN